MILDKSIVTDNVCGFADKLEETVKLLTVSQKYGLTCVYIFHSIYLGDK